MSKKVPITLDNLTSAMKSAYGQNTEPVILLFRLWVRSHYDVEQATPDEMRNIEAEYLKQYGDAEPLERQDALELLDVYGEAVSKITTEDERAAMAIALGYTPLQYEIMKEGISLRELMQALKVFEGHDAPLPNDMLATIFKGVLRDHFNDNQPEQKVPELIERYRREPAMKSVERAKAILDFAGVKLFDPNNPEHLQQLRKLSRRVNH